MSWLDRQSFLGNDSDETLAALTVGIVGLGGGGSHVAQQLAHVGVGNFVLLDPDIITDTNLNRLVGATFSDIQAGTYKVDIAQRVIVGVNPNAKIEKRISLWQDAAELLKECDVIIGGVDKIRAKHELDAFSRRFMIPYIDMGMDVTDTGGNNYLISGQVILTGPGEPCLQCLGIVNEGLLKEEAQTYGDAGSKPQVVWPNGLLASTAVGLFMQLVTPWAGRPRTSAFLEYDGNRNSIVEAAALSFFKTRQCSHYMIRDVGDPRFDMRKLLAKEQDVQTPNQKLPQSWWNRFIRWCSSQRD